MCGLTGIYSTNFGLIETGLFEKALILNVLRGEDSTGVIRVNKNGRIQTKKSLLPSPAFVSSTSADIMEPTTRGNKTEYPIALLGHTRHATKGAVKLENAHPFVFPCVVGMHNGTIHTQFKGRKEYDTDSEALYRLINDVGIEEALNEVEAYDTAYALQWIDTEKKTLNFVKNSARPLFFTYMYSGTTLFWSSEKATLEYLLRWRKYTTNEGWARNASEKYFTLKENHHFEIPLNGDPHKDAKVKELTVKKAYAHSTYSRTTTTSGDSGGVGEWVQKGNSWIFVRKEGTGAGKTIEEMVEEAKTKDAEGKDAKGTGTTTSGTTSGESQKGNSQESLKVTSTSSGATSDQTRGSSGTSETTSSNSKNLMEAHDRFAQSDEEEGGGVAPYGGFRDKFSPDELSNLAWLGGEAPENKGDDILTGLFQENPDPIGKPSDPLARENNVIPFGDPAKSKGKNRKDDDEHNIRGYEGVGVPESEFRYIMSTGCFCCGKVLNLDNPHDFGEINNIKWWSREKFACFSCYNDSEGDWVRHSIDGTWEKFGEDENEGEEATGKAVSG